MIYLDHNATTHVIKPVREILANNIHHPLNASSIHSYGRNARKLLEAARERIAYATGIKLGRGDYKIIFTSGGTEANNLVINNFKNDVVLFSGVEHVSVYKAAMENKNSIELKVGLDGVVDLNLLRDKLKSLNSKKVLVTVMTANNETGVIQPLKEIVKLAREYGALVHTDAIQAFGKIKIDIKELDLDFVSISAHKIGGLPGVGALIVKESIIINPDFIGGGQERGERSGTENVLGAVCFGMAAEYGKVNYDNFVHKMLELRNYIENEIKKTGLGTIIAEDSDRIPNTSLIASRSLSSDLQLIQLDMMGIAVSSGSACSSGKVKNSHVLKAMGYEKDQAEKVIRVSFGEASTMEDVRKFVSAWKEMHQRNQEYKFVI